MAYPYTYPWGLFGSDAVYIRRTVVSAEDDGEFDVGALRRWAGIGASYEGMDADLLDAAVAAASRVAQIIGRPITAVERTDYFPRLGTLVLAGRPKADTIVVKWVDADGAEQTVDAADWTLDDSGRAVLIDASNAADGALQDSVNPVTVSYTDISSEGRDVQLVNEAVRMAFEILVGAAPRRQVATWANVRTLLAPLTPRRNRAQVLR